MNAKIHSASRGINSNSSQNSFSKPLFVTIGFIALPIVLFFIYRSLWHSGPNLYQPWGISLCIILYCLSGYWLAKNSRVSILGGILTFITTVAAASIIIAVPFTNWLTFTFNAIGSLATFGMGIFLVSRKSCFLRSWGIIVILATLAIGLTSGLVSFGNLIQEKEITDSSKQVVIDETDQMISNFFAGWNAHDYKVFSKDFSDDAKTQMSEFEFFKASYAQFGNFISKTNPIVYKQGFGYEVDFNVDFSVSKNMLIHFQVSKLTGQYQITGFKLEPADKSTTHQK